MELCPCPSPPAACLAGSVRGLWGARVLSGAGSPVSTQRGPGVRLQHVVGPQEPRWSSARTKLRDLGAVPRDPAASRSCCRLCRGWWRRWAGAGAAPGFQVGTRGRRARRDRPKVTQRWWQHHHQHCVPGTASHVATRPLRRASQKPSEKLLERKQGPAGAGRVQRGPAGLQPQLCSPLHPELLQAGLK